LDFAGFKSNGHCRSPGTGIRQTSFGWDLRWINYVLYGPSQCRRL